MENKKVIQTNTSNNTVNDSQLNESVLKHAHQHNTTPQHLRLLQYGLKIPSHQHSQISPSHQHQQVNAGYLHLHQHQKQPIYQSTHRYSQKYNTPNTHIYHQHQQKIHQHSGQHLYHLNHPSPQVHSHNSLSQQNAQIWVPHQPPVHYHQPKTEPQPQAPNQTQVKTKEVVERKKSSGNVSQLRSPIAKRPAEAPVTIQGWLHKQGSDGLMLWKRRWFVLSEYCLFYYKGPEEEKLLGSVLLPSYKVSICGPEYKINRKYAFKCEHTNMRTYILAADSQELMMQWIRVLNLACLLQTSMDLDQSVQSTSTYINSGDNSDSGFYQQYNQSQQTIRNTPIHTHTSSNTTDISNPSQELNQYNQPLYANAPPKPRRLNDAGYSSPSPDVLDRYHTEPKCINPQLAYVTQPMHPRSIAKSPVSLYNSNVTHQLEYIPHMNQVNNKANSDFGVREYNIVQNAERRTPDTYGRSKTNPSKGRTPDYEDIYADQCMYKRPLSPLAHNNVKKTNPIITPIQRTYTPVSMLGPRDIVQYVPPQMRNSPSNIPRPHSADFLEYEVNHRQNNPNVANRQPRPKSSLDINRNTSNDNYFYTEERYAEKMRKSTQYLPKMPQRYFQQTQSQQAPKSRPPNMDKTFPLMKSSTQPINFASTPVDYQRSYSQPTRSRSVLSEGSLSKELEVDLRLSPHGRYERNTSPWPISKQEAIYGYGDDPRRRENEQFIRSASARLAQSVQNERIQLDGRIIREGEKKREESMKRLLEWKQRMLQSPLNRKVHQGLNKTYPSKPEIYYKHPENGYPSKMPMVDQYGDGSTTCPMQQYTSYSSDDEENEEGSKENVNTQAGRTLDTLSTESFSPAHSTSTTVFSTPPDETISPSSDNLHDNTKNTSIMSTSTENDDAEDSDAALTKPLKLYNKESPHVAHVSSLRSEFSGKFEQRPVMTEIKSTGALIKNVLAEFEKNEEQDLQENEHKDEKSLTPTRDIESIIEENYMTMTPKKNILEPSSESIDGVRISNAEVEENPYVEMTQGTDISLLNPSNSMNYEQQPYEMVCFNSSKMEPVYMELRPNVLANDSKSKLPDILILSQNNKIKSNKSDSSDADDEASKDLDSLDTPSHPRFSLSDTFRPASYYLGATRTAPELQDSSDSELVSPPPIPRSPPPLDELGESSNQAFSLTENEKKEEGYDQIGRDSKQYFTNNKFANFKKGSNHSLDVKKQNFLPLTNLKDAYSASLFSINMDTEQRFGCYMLHNSDSDVELRSHISRTVDYERMLKRRPVSEEFCDELDLLNSNSNETDKVNFDKYLEDLQVNNVNIVTNNFPDYENLCISQGSSIKNVSLLENLSNLPPCHSRENSRDTVNSKDTVISRCTNISIQSHSRQSSRDTVDTQDSSSRSLLSPDCIHRTRPDSSASISTDLHGFLHNSRHSTPSIRPESSVSNHEISNTSSYFYDPKKNQLSQTAPYYYSDLSMNTSHTDSTSTILTLNNQRSAMIGSKRDITHIVNPIRCTNRFSRNSGRNIRQNIIDNTFKLAAEARSVSVDFLNLTDKSGQIDKKNIYESDTLKRLKAMDSITSLQSNPETRNIFPSGTSEKFSIIDVPGSNVRRSHSLEGLLENVLSEAAESTSVQDSGTFVAQNEESDRTISVITEGSYLWEEDSIWQERLRTASQRHTKSLDDLDCIGETKKQRKQPRGIIRGVTYVNDNIYNMPLQSKHQKEMENKKQLERKNEVKNKENNFIIDREKLRQWDLMSSAPDTQISQTFGVRVNNMVVDMGDEVTAIHSSDQSNVQAQASGSICTNNRDTFPRAISARRIWTPTQQIQSRSSTNLSREHENEYSLSERKNYYPRQSIIQHDVSSNCIQSNASRKGNWQWGGRMNVSAGELLGRTHEELVLLLIQLRRQSTNTYNAIEACYNEIDAIQAQLHLMDAAKQLENLQKLEQIKQHLLELEKQYEKGKPLVNLVDNMVKLGSLYRSPNDRHINPYVRDRLEFNQQIQERRLLAEERRDWNRLNPNNTQLQEKVQQLYQLDRLIQEESGTLQGLQHDKEEIERALGGLRHRLNKGYNDPAEVEQARKQQAILENELSRVHLMLAQNSKKLEETVAGNARLEQELLVLKQKLQISRQQRSSPQFSNAGDSLPCVVGTSAMLESDLQRVQQKVGDLQRQRQELSIQVRQLTDRSNNLQQQIKPFSVNSSANNQGNKKKIHLLWRETDLDTMNIVDHGESWENSMNTVGAAPTTPLYINTDLKQNSDSDFYNSRLKTSDSTSEEMMSGSNFLPQERSEIKTVRIVKRESERRQRDREKTSTGKWDPLFEEDTTSSQSSSVLFRPTPIQKTQSSTNIGPLSPNFETDKTSSGVLSRQSSLSSPSLPQGFSDVRTVSSEASSADKSPELSPVFKSEAARQIIIEMSNQELPKQLNRRAVPKEKRRHYTAPNNNLIIKSFHQLPIDDANFDKLNGRRARDDLDMERALRQRIDAPDVVRSTLSSKELKYNENTIDNILGTPNKINIPERYIPEQLPQLSAEEQEHRLRKVESIKKMLSDTTIISSSSPNLASDDSKTENSPSDIVNKASTKIIEEKKQREHLLQLNQILAKQVMEMSKIVAGSNNPNEQ